MKVHPTHSLSRRLLHWLYCAKCGLLNLKNDATRRALTERCSGSE